MSGLRHAVCRNTSVALVVADSPPLPLLSGASLLAIIVIVARPGWNCGGGGLYHSSFGVCKLPVADSPPQPGTVTTGRGTACLGTGIKVWFLMTVSYPLELATTVVAAAVAEIDMGPVHGGCTSKDNATGGCLGGGVVK